jgi:hypothetical protein
MTLQLGQRKVIYIVEKINVDFEIIEKIRDEVICVQDENKAYAEYQERYYGLSEHRENRMPVSFNV